MAWKILKASLAILSEQKLLKEKKGPSPGSSQFPV